jgi:hypothetical protein
MHKYLCGKPRHLVQAALHNLVVVRDEGGRESMTEGDEAGDVGVARVFCGLATFNQHLNYIFSSLFVSHFMYFSHFVHTNNLEKC